MSLRDVLIDELRDLYSAENQLIKAMPKAAKAVESDALREALTSHMEQTSQQVERLREAFGHLGKKPTGKHCDGMEGAIKEVKEALEEDTEGASFDAGLIGAVSRVEHYEIAGYTVALAMAKALGETGIADLLKETLEEEKRAVKSIFAVAKVTFKQAVAEQEEPEDKPRKPKEKKSEQESEEDEKDAKMVLAGGEPNQDDEDETSPRPARKSAKKTAEKKTVKTNVKKSLKKL